MTLADYRKLPPDEQKALLALPDLKTFYERHPDQLEADRRAIAGGEIEGLVEK